MLTHFVVQNFRSFKQQTTIDFSPQGSHLLEGTNISHQYLKGALFVGANASGKSNLLAALELLLHLLFAKDNPSLTEEYCLLDAEEPLSLEYTFSFGAYLLTYHVTVDLTNTLLTEYIVVNGKKVFEHTSCELQTTVSQFFDSPQPDLHPAILQWLDYLQHSIYITWTNMDFYCPLNPPLTLTAYIKANGVDAINQFLLRAGFSQTLLYIEDALFFEKVGFTTPIPFELESAGIQKLLHLLPAFFYTTEHPSMFIIDEFGLALHNELNELMVQYFMAEAGNSQLFVVSHNTSLLSTTLFRPDQLYAVDFSPFAGSTLTRFSSLNPRVSQNLEHMYNSGVFGGVPLYESRKPDL